MLSTVVWILLHDHFATETLWVQGSVSVRCIDQFLVSRSRHRFAANLFQASPAAALSATVMNIPNAAHAAEGSVWIPALSAFHVGFTTGLATIGSEVGQGIASGHCLVGISRQPEV